MSINIPNTSGVYVIRNLVTGKVYVGSSAGSLRQRWNNHKHQLTVCIHPNRYLQSSWNKHGPKAFEFSVVKTCSPGECILLEQQLIDGYKSSDRRFGYNLCPIAGSSLGRVISQETRDKISKAHKGRRHTPEHSAKIAASNIGKVRSPESRAKMRRARIGYKQGIIAKIKIAVARRKLLAGKRAEDGGSHEQ